LEHRTNPNPLIIAHRGASAVAPENTLAAFQLAMDQGADGIELDVRLSHDGIPVVIHDATLHRTSRREESIGELTAKQLGKTDVGSWFNRAHPRLAQPEYSSQFIPALDKVLKLFATSQHRAMIYVEMKTAGPEDSDLDLALSVADLIGEAAPRNQVIVISFDLKAVAEIKRINPAIQTGALFEPKRNPQAAIRKRQMIEAAVDCGADEILLHRLICTNRTVQLATERNLRSVVWTVDDPRWLGRAAALGIHAIITNKPAAFMT
jgi:glycerophosphoryl diester phosphodiesterase